MARQFDIRPGHERASDAISVGIVQAKRILSGPVGSDDADDSNGSGHVVQLSAKSFGAGHRVTVAVKNAVAAGSTSDAGYAGNLAFKPLTGGISEDFIDSLRNLDSYDASSGPMHRMDSNSVVRVLAAVASGTLVAQSAPKPLQALSFSQPALSMLKLIALCVVNDEVIKHGRNAERILSAALRGGVAIGTGAAFLAMLANGVTPVAASGTTAAAFLADLAGALSQIKVGAGSRIYAAASSQLLKQLALLPATDGSRAFPELDVTGGSVGGVIFVPDDSVEHDTSGSSITVYDASRVITSDEGIDVRASREATIQFDDQPTNPPVAATVAHSLFQENRVALLAERYIGFAKISDDCCAVISGANYGVA